MPKNDVIPHLFPVVMAGGKGTRFWPLSREKFPKQYLKLAGERSLLQDTLMRLGVIAKRGSVHIVTTEAQKDIVDWQAREVMKDFCTVVEPEGKNTAPAIALMAFKLMKKDKDALLLVLPSDHYIRDIPPFEDAVAKAAVLAAQGRIVTFGIIPSRPETGFGYIKAGRTLGGGAYNVSRFVEKPDLKTARSYLRQGGFYWNSGMFLFRAKDMIEELKRHMPATFKAFDSVKRSLNGKTEEKALRAAYAAVDEESIDYGIMEKAKRVAVVKADFHWSDIGSWSALEEVVDPDRDGNVREGNVVSLECRDSIFYTDNRLLGAVGIKGMVVVNTPDATLIIPKDRVQEVKDLVTELKLKGREEHLAPRLEERPWGYFEVLDRGPTYQIKHIYLKPGARLSLQMHNHRSEHWIVVSGSATVTRGEAVFIVHQNESTFIPATEKHRLENKGKIPLRIIEIQSGEYLGEDDIIRFNDVYGRKTK
jgi:mannose-1-phosphate guanylyltransferase/mannose-6-phosphate isomerase